MNVGPGIREHTTVHYSRPDRGYQLPINFVWQIVGLGKLFDEPALDCCGRNIDFVRDLSMKRRALFSRKGTAFVVKSKPNPDNYDIQISIPNEISGMTYVFPGSSEFHYEPGKAPRLRIVDGGLLIFDDELRCTNSSAPFAAVKRVNPGKNRPNLNMVVQEPD